MTIGAFISFCLGLVFGRLLALGLIERDPVHGVFAVFALIGLFGFIFRELIP